MKTMKFLLILIFSGMAFQLSAQVNANTSQTGGGAMLITPKGISGKFTGGGNPSNVAVGDGSSLFTTGNFNTAIGSSSLLYNKANSGSVAIGYGAMSFADDRTAGRVTNNTAVGYYSLAGSSVAANNTGTDNTAIGANTLKSNITGVENTAIGSYGLQANTHGYENIALGVAGLVQNINGNRNIAIGTTALFSNKANHNSIAIGHSANQYGDDRTSNGLFTNNIAIGTGAMIGQSPASNNIGINNLAIGSYSLQKYTSGSQNVAIGNNSANFITSGSGNVMLGYNAGGTTNVSNKLFIANSNTNNPLIKGNFSTGEVKINNKLKVGGISSDDTPTATLEVYGNIALSRTGILDPGVYDNLNFSGVSIIYMDLPGNYTINGIANGVHGMILYIISINSIGNPNVNIVNKSPSALYENRILTGSGGDISISGDGGVTLIYLGGDWHVIGVRN